MPLVDRPYYALREALQLIAEKLPGEDPLDNLVEAQSVPFPNEKLRAWVVSEKNGQRWVIEAGVWGSRDFRLTDREKGIGWLRVRGRLHPIEVTGQVQIDRAMLDALLGGTTAPSEETGQEAEPGSEPQRYARWADEIEKAKKRGTIIRDTARVIAAREGVDYVYVEREARRVRENRQKRESCPLK